MSELHLSDSAHCLTILFVGAAGLDTLTFLDSYPAEDAKVRALQQRIEGGGNAANCAVTAGKLGVSSHLFSAVGNDVTGDAILDGLRSQGVNIDHVVRQQGNSGTTYVIVCNSTSTRTCIHNPIANAIARTDTGEVFRFVVDERVPFVHFDSRHTEAAVALAQCIADYPFETHRKPIISIDMEKIRPHVLDLLSYCEVIFTNQTFPSHLAPDEPDLSQRLLNVLAQPWAGRCKILITTLGAGGSVVLYKPSEWNRLRDRISSTVGVECSEWAELHHRVKKCAHISTTCSELSADSSGNIYKLISISAYPLCKEQVVDTTGAGDAFIGAFLSALAHGWMLQDCAKLGTMVAALKIQQPGARQGLPSVAQLLIML